MSKIIKIMYEKEMQKQNKKHKKTTKQQENKKKTKQKNNKISGEESYGEKVRDK